MSSLVQRSNVAGTTICNQLNTIVATAVALQIATETLTNHGARLFCAGATVLAGLGNLTQGNVISGTTMTVTGAREVYSIFKAADNTQEIARLLNDASAGVKMIQTLEEANSQSFNLVKSNLTMVKQNVKSLKSQLEKIEAVAAAGSAEVNQKKAEATKLYREAEELYKESYAHFKTCKKRFNKSNELFSKALVNFAPLYAAAHSTEGDPKARLSQFIKLAQNIQRQCEAGQKVLGDGSKILDSALEKLNEAVAKQSLAAEKTGEAIESAQAHLQLIQAKAANKQLTEDSEKKINEMFGEIKQIERRNADKGNLLNKVQSNVKEANERANEALTSFEAAVGGGLGGLWGGAVAGAPGAIAGAYAGAKIMHNRRAIGSKIFDWAFSVKNESKPVMPSTLGINFSFDKYSSGILGRILQKQSWTVGQIAVNLGNNEYMQLKFDLSAKDHVGDNDLFNLQNRMMEKLKNGEITHRDCLKIINELKTSEICRGDYDKVTCGFIREDNPFFNELKTICNGALGLKQ